MFTYMLYDGPPPPASSMQIYEIISIVFGLLLIIFLNCLDMFKFAQYNLVMSLACH